MINSTVLSISLAMYALLAIHVIKKTFNVWEITFSINNWPKKVGPDEDQFRRVSLYHLKLKIT
jgi:hypothetical protein